MKKIILSLLVGFSFLTCNAQIFDKGNKGFNLGIAVDPFVDFTPRIHFSGEAGVIPLPNAGIISLGGNVDLNFVDFSELRTFLAFRAAFHFGFIKSDKYDIYAGLGIGVKLHEHNSNNLVYTEEFIGARMLLTETLGLFLELGYGPTAAKFGVSWLF